MTTMSLHDSLPLSPPSTSSRRKTFTFSSSVKDMSELGSPVSFPGSSSAGGRKRVGFSSTTDDPTLVLSSQPPSSVYRPVLASSDSQSSLKSILKPTLSEDRGAGTSDGSQEKRRSIPDMMDGLLTQLSQDDRAVAVDAYQTLNSIVRNYDDLPEEEVLKAKINMFMKYIKRDLLRQLSTDGPSIADSNLQNQALKVLIMFVWNKDYANLLSDESRVFVLDRSIQVLGERTAPKTVINHYLHVLATQNFRQTLVTSHRITRLLEALKPLHEHYTGNNILSERLLVYQKLLDQGRATMKAKANLWIEELLGGMHHAQNDMRMKAINLGLKACSAFPASSSISGVVQAILARELTPEKTFSANMCRRLEKMIAAKDGAQVPQIWIIVLRLCSTVDDRGRNAWGTQCDKWPQFKDWLSLVQRCFNSSDAVVLQQTYAAWNHFIHIVQPHLSSDNLRSLLAKPIISKLERGGGDQTSKGTRVAALTGYCTLLYYAFRPAATHEQYTKGWNEYIAKVMKPSFFDHCRTNADFVSRIFVAMFWNTKGGAKLWNESRALESARITPEELPTIDSKWLRTKARPILEVFRALTRYSAWGATDQPDKSYIVIAWIHFLEALREASRKEIKPSPETIEAVAHVIKFLGSSWLSLLESTGESQAILLNITQIRKLSVNAVAILGQDLIMAGLGDKGYCLSKVLVIYDALKQASSSNQWNEVTKASFETCRVSLDFALVQDFKSEKSTRTNLQLAQLQQRLDHSGAQKALDTLTLLSKAITSFLSEDISRWQDKSQDEVAKQYPDVVALTLDLLATVSPSAIEELDDLLAALFGSTNGKVVQDTIDTWNQHLGLQDPKLGSKLSEVIVRLNSAGFTILGRPVIRRLTTEQQPSLSCATGEAKHNSQPQLLPLSSKKGDGIDSPLSTQQQHKQTVVPSNKAVVTSSPPKPSSRARPRHDDSQAQFVPIVSSPLLDEEPESQLLTEHQKEVRNRQRAEPAVVFPDVRSSPIPRTKTAQRNSEFARKAASQSERPSTPTLPANDDRGELDTPTSPTPRARHVVNRITDIEVPSSPPSVLGNAERQEITSSPPPANTNANGIDLALEVELAEGQGEQVTVEVEATEADAALKTNNVEPTPTQVEDNVQMAEIHAGDVVDDFQHNQSSLLQVPTDAERNDDFDVLLPDVLGRLNPNDDLLPIDQQMAEHGQEEEQIAQPVQENLSSSQPLTINITSDSTTKDDDAEDVGPSTQSQVRADSDDIDRLSASQLSHDLNQHLSQAASFEEEDDAMGTSQPEVQQERKDCVKTKQKLRKRKSSSQKFTSVKRRKSQTPSQRTSYSAEAEDSICNTAGEMLDCIEVSPSQAVQAVATLDSQDAPTVPKRRPGRPRKRPMEDTTQSEPPKTTVEVVVEGSSLKAEPLGEVGAVMSPNHVETEHEHSLERDADAEEVAPTTIDLREAVADEATARPSITTSLKDILARLKSETAEDVDLRTVDDLCFQIRFQAQLLAQEKGS